MAHGVVVVRENCPLLPMTDDMGLNHAVGSECYPSCLLLLLPPHRMLSWYILGEVERRAVVNFRRPLLKACLSSRYAQMVLMRRRGLQPLPATRSCLACVWIVRGIHASLFRRVAGSLLGFGQFEMDQQRCCCHMRNSVSAPTEARIASMRHRSRLITVPSAQGIYLTEEC